MPTPLTPRPIDVTNVDAMRAEAERRQKLRAQGKPLNGVGSWLPAIDYNRVPLNVRLPWSVLVPDNEKYGVSKGRIILTERYRKAKSLIRSAAKDQVCEELLGTRAFKEPCAILAKVYVPNTRTRDIANFTKLVHDALETVCYTNDSLLYDVHWIRAGVDVDAPRVEITVSLITA